MAILRQYNAATTIDFPLYETTGNPLQAAATFAAGDVTFSIDGGVEANTTNLPADEGQGYSLALTAAELNGARIRITIKDLDGPAWMDQVIIIETYGAVGAQHPNIGAPEVVVGSLTTAALDSIRDHMHNINFQFTRPQIDPSTGIFRVGVQIIDERGDLPSTAEINPGEIAIARKAPGGAGYIGVVSATAMTEVAGEVYIQRTMPDFYAGDVVRVSFTNVNVVIDGVTYEYAGATARIFYTQIYRNDPDELLSTTIQTVTSQTEWILTDGAPEDDVYNGDAVIVTDNVNGFRKGTAIVDNWDQGTSTLTLVANPDFSVLADDIVQIVRISPVPVDTLSTAALAQINTEVQAALTAHGLTTGRAALMDNMDALVSSRTTQAEVDASLIAIGLDHLLSTSAANGDVADNSIMAQIVSGSSPASWASYDNQNMSLETIRGAVGIGLLQFTNIASIVTADLSFTLNAGSTVDDQYNGKTIIIIDESDNTVKFTGEVLDYVGGATKQVTLVNATDFTIAINDTVLILGFEGPSKLDELHDNRLTSGRASNLDNLDVTVSSRSSHAAPDLTNLDVAVSSRATQANVATELDTRRLNELFIAALSGQPVAESLFADLTEDNGGTQRFTVDALANGPSGGAGGFTAADRTKLDDVEARLTQPRADNLDNLDAAVSSRSSHGDPDLTKLDELHDNRITAGRAATLDNLDVAVSSRSSHAAPDVSNLDVAVSSRSSHGPAAVTADIDANSTQLAQILTDITVNLTNIQANATPAEVLAQIETALATTLRSELTAKPGANVTIIDALLWVFALVRNRIEFDGTTLRLKADDGTTDIATAAPTDDTSTAIVPEWT
jgi:hypothetical protein